MKIDVTYDFVCPWCYLAISSLERAVSSKPHIDVELWPFQLTPEVPETGVDHDAFFNGRVGEATAKERYRQMEALAAQAAIPLDYSSIRVLPNTLLAHRVVRFAQLNGKGLAVLNALMRAHFTGSNIGDIDVVARISDTKGVNAELLRTYLRDEASGPTAQKIKQHATSHGICGVPHFEIDGVASPGGRTVGQWRTMLLGVAA